MTVEEAGGAGLPSLTAAAVPPGESEVSPRGGVTETQAGPAYAGADRRCVMPRGRMTRRAAAEEVETHAEPTRMARDGGRSPGTPGEGEEFRCAGGRRAEKLTVPPLPRAIDRRRWCPPSLPAQRVRTGAAAGEGEERGSRWHCAARLFELIDLTDNSPGAARVCLVEEHGTGIPWEPCEGPAAGLCGVQEHVDVGKIKARVKE